MSAGADAALAALDSRIQAEMADSQRPLRLLQTIPGIDFGACTILPEIGPDLRASVYEYHRTLAGRLGYKRPPRDSLVRPQRHSALRARAAPLAPSPRPTSAFRWERPERCGVRHEAQPAEALRCPRTRALTRTANRHYHHEEGTKT